MMERRSAIRSAGIRSAIALTAILVTTTVVSPAGSRDNAAFAEPPVLSRRPVTDDDLRRLPDSTQLTLHAKSHAIDVTLGQLRAGHAALIRSLAFARAANAGTIGSIAGARIAKTITPPAPSAPKSGTALIPSTQGIERIGSSAIVATPKPSQGLGNPTMLKSALATTRILPLSVQTTVANDYTTFCKNVDATLCLYYPTGVIWLPAGDADPGNYAAVDPLTSTQNACAGLGGQMKDLGMTYPGSSDAGGHPESCVLQYPGNAQVANYYNGFDATGWCDTAPGWFTSQFQTPVTTSSLFFIGDNGAQAQAANGSTETFCFFRVSISTIQPPAPTPLPINL